MVNAGRACYMGMGVRMPKYLTIYYRSTGSLHENMRICQGNLGEFSGKNCPTSIAINQLAVKITRRSLSFGCICINSSTCWYLTSIYSPHLSLILCLKTMWRHILTVYYIDTGRAGFYFWRYCADVCQWQITLWPYGDIGLLICHTIWLLQLYAMLFSL